MVGEAKGQGWRKQDWFVCCCKLDGSLCDRGDYRGIGADRQVVGMLFSRAERDHDGSSGRELAKVVARQRVEPPGATGYRHGLPPLMDVAGHDAPHGLF
jgi:hypothetical protein